MYEVQIRKMALSIERSDDEIGRLEHELATALGLAQRKDSKGLAQMRASLAELKEPRQNDMSQQVGVCSSSLYPCLCCRVACL